MVLEQENENLGDSGKWNVAKQYSEGKIMRYLQEADEYELIATFGSSNFNGELYNVLNGIPEDALKIRGLRRLIKTLLLLISNSYFALKPAGKTEFTEHEKTLNKINTIISSLYKTTINQVNKTSNLIINNNEYNKVLNLIIDIKKALNDPLLDAGLIYIKKDSFDPKAWKDKVKQRIIEEG